jgi:hypothetical protein
LMSAGRDARVVEQPAGNKAEKPSMRQATDPHR